MHLFTLMMAPWHYMNRLAENTSPGLGFTSIPKAKTSETEKEYRYAIDLDGYKRDQIALSFRNGMIMLRVENNDFERGRNHRYRHAYSLRHAFSLPGHTDAESIKAHFKDGKLTIHVPKVHKHIRGTPHTVPIE